MRLSSLQARRVSERMSSRRRFTKVARVKHKPFKAVNCGAFYQDLLQSELFGHEKGAFTGAINQRRGVFEQADAGTLFLDEVAEMSPEVQVKFLRVLETQEFTRLGGERNIKVNVRIIAATNVNLATSVRQKKI